MSSRRHWLLDVARGSLYYGGQILADVVLERRQRRVRRAYRREHGIELLRHPGPGHVHGGMYVAKARREDVA